MPKIFAVSDHAGFNLKYELIKSLPEYDWIDLNPDLEPGDDFPLKAELLARKVEKIDNFLAIAVCGSGQGICMALNRFPWIRAGIGYDLSSALEMRADEDANVLCLPGRHLDLNKAKKILNTFISTSLKKEAKYTRRIGQLYTLK